MFKKLFMMTMLFALGVNAMGFAAEKTEEKALPRLHYAYVEVKDEAVSALDKFFMSKMKPAVAKEPGTLGIYHGIADKQEGSEGTPFYFFEFYQDMDAYQAHLANPVFKEYIETTAPDLLDKKLNATLPTLIQLRNKKTVGFMEYVVYAVPDEEAKEKALSIMENEALRAYKADKNIYAYCVSVEEKDPLKLYVWIGYKNEDVAEGYHKSKEVQKASDALGQIAEMLPYVRVPQVAEKLEAIK